MDRGYRSAIISKALQYLYAHGANEAGDALYPCRIRQLRRPSDGRLIMVLYPKTPEDAAALAGVIRNPVENGTMPGPLDYAFEFALPSREWPLFIVLVPKRAARAA